MTRRPLCWLTAPVSPQAGTWQILSFVFPDDSGPLGGLILGANVAAASGLACDLAEVGRLGGRPVAQLIGARQINVTPWAGFSLIAKLVIGLCQQFAGRRSFEFMTMLSFAIPGTVIGVSYIVAFNVPPLELTGGLAILVICFVFRNMPVGVRAGMAAMSQIDRSLDEASLTLGERSFGTLRRVLGEYGQTV